MFEVVNQEKMPSRVIYTTVDFRSAEVGRAIVSYTKRKSYWRYISRTGKRISNKETIRKMTDAISRFHDATN